MIRIPNVAMNTVRSKNLRSFSSQTAKSPIKKVKKKNTS